MSCREPSTRTRRAICGVGIALAAMASSVPPSPAHAEEPFVLGPPNSEGPVVVRAGFTLRDVNEIDDEAETFEFDGVLMLQWRDERLAFDPVTAGVEEKIYQGSYQFDEVFTGWFPQVTLVNESGLYEKQGVLCRVRPDGSVTLLETVNAVAKSDLDLRHYPFDAQQLEAVFEVLGFDATEVVFELSPAGASKTDVARVRMPQWHLHRVELSTRDAMASLPGREEVASTFVVRIDAARDSLYMVRLVIIPLGLIVMLSWSVFWMDQSSLGDRINVSFIGILTVVAYQMVLSEILPRIAYLTMLTVFLNISFIVICASVVVSLVVGWLDRGGNTAAGDRIDRRCRWIFPLVYVSLILFAVLMAFVVLP